MRERARADLRCSYLSFVSLQSTGGPLAFLRLLLPVVVSVVTAACSSGPKTFVDVEDGSVHVIEPEAEALRGLLSAAGLQPWQLGVEGELASESGHWVEIDDAGHVWALGLSAVAELDSLTPLANLPRLSRVRIQGASLHDLKGLESASELSFLLVHNSGLESLAGLEGCEALRVLDLRSNAIVSIAELPNLPELRTLDLASNKISAVEGLVGREKLESLDLSDNALAIASGIADLPSLERLDLARNRLISLGGLAVLPKLRELLAQDNRMIDASVVDALPALEIVNLNGNRLETFPQLVKRLPQYLWQENPGTRHHQQEEVDARLRREREPQRANELPATDRFDSDWSRGLCTWSGTRPKCDVLIPRMKGAGIVYLARFDLAELRTDPRRHPPSVRLHLDVGKGAVSAFLQGYEETYPFVTATPGEPGALVGNLFASGQGVWFILEAVDGAEDVRYRIEPELGG